MTSINTLDKTLYQDLSLVIQAYEEGILRSGHRDGLIAVAHSPIQAMETLLTSSSKALRKNRSSAARKQQSANQGKQGIFQTTERESNLSSPISSPPSVTLNTTDFNESMDVSIFGGEDPLVDLSSVQFDPALQRILGANNLQDYLAECMNCDFRVQFEWQLKPIDLLGPIANMIQDINVAINGFRQQMSPWTSLENLCDILNNTSWLCLPDLISIFSSLKMLLQSYLTSQFSLSLDWTVLLGPLLKTLLDGITSLMNAVAGVLTGPLDCTVGALKAMAELQKQMQHTFNSAVAVGQRIGDRADQLQDLLSGEKTTLDKRSDISLDILYKDGMLTTGSPGGATTVNQDVDGREARILQLIAPTPPEVRTRTRRRDLIDGLPSEDPADWSQWTFPSGLDLTSNVRLPDAVNNPKFWISHWTTKLTLVVQEAKNYIVDLVRKVNSSLNSLQSLTRGGLGLQLGNLGLILFIKDMIALILLIIDLFSNNRDVTDWCDFLERNPALLEDALSRSAGRASVKPEKDQLVLMRGDEVLGRIKTCTGNTSSKEQALLNQWISELKKGAA